MYALINFLCLLCLLLLVGAVRGTFISLASSTPGHGNHTVAGSAICVHGFINSKGKCVCMEDYITWPETQTLECNYEQRKQLTAFWWTLFLGFYGAGRFYIGDTKVAMAFLVPGIITSCYTIAKKHCLKPDHRLPYLFFFGIVPLWGWCTDLLVIIRGGMCDDHDAPLASWDVMQPRIH